MNCVYTAYTGNNPAGIDINLGYYALAECLIKGTDASKALLRWCGVWFDKTKPRKMYEKKHPYTKPMGEKTKRILSIYEKNPTLRTKEIAEHAGCTPEAVRRILRKIGVKKKNKWDGYISTDPRYSKDKRGK